MIFGQVLQAGEGQITARQAATRAGIPMTVPSLTINKVCLSGLAAIGHADRSVRLGEAGFVMAGGMESMSNAPYVVPAARWGARIGDTPMVDVLQHDGLFCAFDHCTMGESSDHKNRQLGISRQAAGRVVGQKPRASRRRHRLRRASPPRSPRSGSRSAKAIRLWSTRTRASVATPPPRRLAATAARLRRRRDHHRRQRLSRSPTVAPPSSSPMRRGPVAIGSPILARILAYGQIGGVDATLHERPAEALRVALKKANLTAADLHAVEINEAFAAVALWSAKMLEIPEERININGGAVALGHPIGATGARLVVSLINQLRQRGGGLGAATLCGGGGQGDAMIIEVVS